MERRLTVPSLSEAQKYQKDGDPRELKVLLFELLFETFPRTCNCILKLTRIADDDHFEKYIFVIVELSL